MTAVFPAVVGSMTGQVLQQGYVTVHHAPDLPSLDACQTLGNAWVTLLKRADGRIAGSIQCYKQGEK